MTGLLIVAGIALTITGLAWWEAWRTLHELEERAAENARLRRELERHVEAVERIRLGRDIEARQFERAADHILRGGR